MRGVRGADVSFNDHLVSFTLSTGAFGLFGGKSQDEDMAALRGTHQQHCDGVIGITWRG